MNQKSGLRSYVAWQTQFDLTGPWGAVPLIPKGAQKTPYIGFQSLLLPASLLHGNPKRLAQRRIFKAMSRCFSRAERVSFPCTVLASAQIFLPSSDVGPVERPPWNLHLVFPLIAGPQHWSFVRLLMAVHRRQTILPPAVVRMLSLLRSVDLTHMTSTEYTTCIEVMHSPVGVLWLLFASDAPAAY